MSTAYLRGVAWAEQTLTPLAERLVAAIEDPPEQPLAPRLPARDLESELLRGSGGGSSATRNTPAASPGPAEFISTAEAHQLRSDCDALLQQRERLRAQLIAEQERRERAEAELVAVGAQWLGTETQAALRLRADAEQRRALEAARAAIQREADQRVAKLEAERALLLDKLGEGAPSRTQLRAQLRAALQQELEHERSQAREAVRTELEAALQECDRLTNVLRTSESTHRAELELLRASVRKASELMQEQYDQGFVLGLKEAASALAHTALPPHEVPQSALQPAQQLEPRSAPQPVPPAAASPPSSDSAQPELANETGADADPASSTPVAASTSCSTDGAATAHNQCHNPASLGSSSCCSCSSGGVDGSSSGAGGGSRSPAIAEVAPGRSMAIARPTEHAQSEAGAATQQGALLAGLKVRSSAPAPVPTPPAPPPAPAPSMAPAMVTVMSASAAQAVAEPEGREAHAEALGQSGL